MSDTRTDDLSARVQARIGEQTRTGLHGDARLIADLFDALAEARAANPLPDGYIITYATEFANGTIQLTCKPCREAPDE